MDNTTALLERIAQLQNTVDTLVRKVTEMEIQMAQMQTNLSQQSNLAIANSPYFSEEQRQEALLKYQSIENAKANSLPSDVIR